MSLESPIVCSQCDLLQQGSILEPGDKAMCGRCGNVLYRYDPKGLQLSLVFALTSAILFIIANAFPIVTIGSDGLTNSTTFIGAVERLIHDGIPSIAILVFITTCLMPAIQITSLIYLLLPLSFGHLPPRLAFAFRLIYLVKPWAMIEVFMLGLLVTIAKLNAFASVTPDIALGSFALLMMALTAASAKFDARQFWNQVESLRAVEVSA